ncbi:MAG: nuclear transport factor 2 family protein [Actinomycetota bacterium]|nr:nuclear transport factor 2 family protein [Actinomycetota bacterium]
MPAGTWESHHAITTLLFRYAEMMDAADYDGLRVLFANAVLTNEGYPGEVVGGTAIVRLYERTNRVHDDGTLRTRHLTDNVQVDIEESAGTAQARSAFVVFQATPLLPLQPVVTGRYRDDFARVRGKWQFARRHIFVDHVGDVSQHLNIELTPAGGPEAGSSHGENPGDRGPEAGAASA